MTSRSSKNQLSPEELLFDEWVKKATEDELSAQAILVDREGSPGTVCFLSQQISEKYLKGFLVFHQQDFPKIHQLDRLVRLCGKIEPSVSNLMEEARFLRAFYVTTRYPGDYPEFSWRDAEAAYKAAQRVKEFVLKKLKKP